MLITDQGSAVDAIDQRNRVRGILCGKDANGCLLKYIRGNLDIKEGDLVITSGKDGVYPKGLRLGVVLAVYKDPVDLFQKIEVKPIVRLSALEEVLIIKRGGVGTDAEEETRPAAAAASRPNPRPRRSLRPKLQAKPLATHAAGKAAGPGNFQGKASGLKASRLGRTPNQAQGQTKPQNRPREKPQTEPQGQAKPKPKVDAR